jgi:hypothetical protein
LLSKDEAKYKNLPNGTGMFSELFNLMEIELKGHPNNRANYRKAQYMTPEEKRISFMNRYFIFKKIRDVDVKKMAHVISKELEFDEKHSEEDKKELMKIIEERDNEDKEKKEEEKKEEKEEEPIKKKKRLVLKKQPEIPVVSISKEKMFITIKK